MSLEATTACPAGLRRTPAPLHSTAPHGHPLADGSHHLRGCWGPTQCATCLGRQLVDVGESAEPCPALDFCPEADTLLCRLPDGTWDWSPHGGRDARLARLATLDAKRGLSPALMAAVAAERHGVSCPKCSASCTLTEKTAGDGRRMLRADCPTHGYVKFVSPVSAVVHGAVG
jgi:hypothetical protein